jgi:3D (Asp-Asp-Asp) domain-containing protein
MSITPFSSASGGFTNISSFPDIPPNSAAMRAQMEVPSAELATYINNTLIPGIADISGWIPSVLSFAYSAVNVITVAGDQTGIFYQGIKIKYTQDATVKYALVESSVFSANTLIAIRSYDSNALTSSVISNVSYSTAFAPVGFPINPPAIVPTMGNSWVNFGSGLSTAAYWKDVMNIVHLNGCIKSGTLNATIFTLPTGYLPLGILEPTVQANSAAGTLYIRPSGSVELGSGSNVLVSLDSITFRAGV